jgi:hypothetical protein
MKKRLMITAAALLVAAPAVAQTAPAPAPVDPAALAEARLVVAHLMPPGIYKQMMGPMMAPITDNMTETMKAFPLREAAEIGGLDPAKAAALDKVNIAEVMAIYDPHWQERMKLSMTAMYSAMGDFFTSLEPEIRESMAHAYANHFTLAELTDIDRFFETPSGGKFSSQYITIAADPAMAAEMKSMLPKMLQRMPDFVAAAKKATDSLPPARKLKDLTPAERDRLAKALGVDQSTLRDPKSTT